MKIALCLSGQPRFMKIGYKFIKKYIIDPNNQHQIDLFLHAWHNPEDTGKPYNSAQPYPSGHVGIVEADTDKFLIEKYQPKKFLLEPQINFNDYAKNLPDHPTAKKNIMSSIFYSIYKSNELKREYEKENNFIYDLVIRTRYDLAYYNPIIVTEHLEANNKIAVLKNYQEDQDVFQSLNKPMPDIFSFSNSKNMDIFCSVFPNMQEISKNLDVPFGERYLGEWVRNKNKIELYKFDSKVVLLHRMPDLRRYL